MKFLIIYTSSYRTPIQGSPLHVGIIEADSHEDAANKLGLKNPEHVNEFWGFYPYENKGNKYFPTSQISLQKLPDVSSSEDLDKWMREENQRVELLYSKP